MDCSPRLLKRQGEHPRHTGIDPVRHGIRSDQHHRCDALRARHVEFKGRSVLERRGRDRVDSRADAAEQVRRLECFDIVADSGLRWTTRSSRCDHAPVRNEHRDRVVLAVPGHVRTSAPGVRDGIVKIGELRLTPSIGRDVVVVVLELATRHEHLAGRQDDDFRL